MSRRHPLTFALLVALLAPLACDRSDTQDASPDPPEFRERELLEPLVDPQGQAPCRRDQSAVTLRARDGQARSQSVEVGGAAFFDGGLAVAALRQGSESRALLFIWTDDGRSFEVDLGRVFGGLEFPEIAAFGAEVFVVISDNEATSRRLRVARVRPLGSLPDVSWGPSYSVARDESEAKALLVNAEAVHLAWDDDDLGRGRSAIVLSTMSRQTLQEQHVARAVTPPTEDAVEPRLVQLPTGIGLTYVALEVDPRALSEQVLVEEPRRHLMAQLLDARGQPTQQAQRLSEPDQQVLAQTSASWDGHWAVAYRWTRVGNSRESAAIDTVRIALDGSTARRRWTHDELGPGAPLLLTDRGGEPWLLTPGEDGQLLGARFATEDGLEPVLGREPAWALSRRGEQLAVMTPSGLDFAFRRLVCQFP